MTTAEIIETLRLACWHGYPVSVVVGGVRYDGWVRGSKTPSSVTVSLGTQDYDFEWVEIETATFYSSLAERLTGRWLKDHLER